MITRLAGTGIGSAALAVPRADGVVFVTIKPELFADAR